VSEYRTAIRAVAIEMLVNRRMEPSWAEIKNWFNAQSQSDNLCAFRQIAQCSEIVQLSEKSGIERIKFRHDRVRAWLLTDAITERLRARQIDESTLSDPFFADVIGAALADPSISSEDILKIQALNPLALFYALKSCSLISPARNTAIPAAINEWLSSEQLFDRNNKTLRYAALQVLSETEGPNVINFTKKFRDNPFSALSARFRNGDMTAGIQLCQYMEPGVGSPWRDYQIEHAKLRFGRSLIQKVDEILKGPELSKATRSGALRLAGHLADPLLGNALSCCWALDTNRIECLADYLWAAAECCGVEPEKLLGPVCDTWAALPSGRADNDRPSTKDDLAADHISWAFNRTLPTPALRYFIDRANNEDLRGPITYMLRAVDHPDAVEFIAHQLAVISQRIEGTDSFSIHLSLFKNHWKRKRSDTGKGMSSASRKRLQQLWRCVENDKYLRIQAFELWAATLESDDLKLLNAIDTSQPLANKILRARLERGDQSAIPAFIEKLQDDEWGNWWQLGKHIWADELTAALDEALQKRGAEIPLEWYCGYKLDFIIANLFPTLNASTAEQLLTKHWKHLRFTRKYVQNALYIASPTSIELAEEAISSCPEPRKLLEHLHFQLGVKVSDHPGVNNIRQFEVLIPYLDYLDSMDIYFIWEHCNDRNWFEFRRTHLDSRLEERWRKDTLLDKTDFFEKLDVIIQKSGAYWRIEDLIDEYLKQGEQVAQIFEFLREWLNKHRTIAALEVVAAAIIHVGKREDLNLLNIEGIEPSDQAKAIIRDACFGVKLRSLS
jgi:sulfur relay (sulfurtransferase) DsrC/TusE family protein